MKVGALIVGLDKVRLKARSALILAAGAGILWLSTSITASTVLADYHPHRAFQAWPTDAARVSLAWRLLTASETPQNRDIERAEQLSRQALSREAVSVGAIRNIGISRATKGNSSDAVRPLFSGAERLSRRDVPTELWLVEDNVSRGNVTGALRHYDVLMRSSRTAQLTMIPQLVRASVDQPVAKALAMLLVKRPHWWSAFYDQMLTDGTNAGALALMASALNLRPEVPSEHEQLARSLTKLVELKSYEAAFALYRNTRSSNDRAVAWPHNGGFSTAKPLPPFEWSLALDADLGGVVEPRTGADGPALTLVATNGRKGVVAQQLLLLRPGSYVLKAMVGASPANKALSPVVRLVCADSGTTIAETTLVDTPVPSNILSLDVSIEACRTQWIIILAQASDPDPDELPWIDSLVITPAKN